VQASNIFYLVLISGLLFLGACGTSSGLNEGATKKKVESKWVPAISRSAGISEVRTFNRLKSAYSDWQGTPYLWGGDSRNGVDCSAFMQVVFKDYFNKQIPRTTEQQMKVGKKIRKKWANIGDLVFFKTGSTTYHVGVMVDDRYFLHAGPSRGVMISDLEDSYWSARYLMARKIL
jgi:cell wall-associated NlpC family hydrolase